MKTQGPLRLASPAKITPVLRVLRRRADGYHDVALVLVPVSLCDSVEFTFGEAGGIALSVESAEPLGNPTDNLVFRAAQAFGEELGRPVQARIRLLKRIPAGAGLGGGSGNAAATLLALNAAHGFPLKGGQLRRIAGGLGADVPFFLDPVPSVARGRGEILEPLPAFPRLPLLIIRPPFAIATGEAYGWVRPNDTGRPLPPLTTPAQVVGALENAFAEALFPRFPQLENIGEALRKAGAMGVVVSGTGSALVGVFPDDATRDLAARALKGRDGWTLFSCETLSRFVYALPPGP